MVLLLYDARRYQAALSRIFEKEREQKALVDHKTATGQVKSLTGNDGLPILMWLTLQGPRSARNLSRCRRCGPARRCREQGGGTFP